MFLTHCLPPSLNLPPLQTLQHSADRSVSGQLWFLRNTCSWSSHLAWTAQFWPKVYWALTRHDRPHQMLLFTCLMIHGSIRLFRPQINPAWKKFQNSTRTLARNKSQLLSCYCLIVTKKMSYFKGSTAGFFQTWWLVEALSDEKLHFLCISSVISGYEKPMSLRFHTALFKFSLYLPISVFDMFALLKCSKARKSWS